MAMLMLLNLNGADLNPKGRNKSTKYWFSQNMPSSFQSSLWIGNILKALSMSVFAMNVPGPKSKSAAIALSILVY